MPISPTVEPPSSRPTSRPSALSTGTRRSIASSAPIMNSASATALAVTLRTTSTPARPQASTSMFSAPELSRPDGAQHRRVVQHLGIERDRGRDDQRTHVEQRLAQRTWIACQLGRIAHGMAFAEPLHDLRLERFNDQDVHAIPGLRRHGTRMRRVPESACLPALIVSKCTYRRRSFPWQVSAPDSCRPRRPSRRRCCRWSTNR